MKFTIAASVSLAAVASAAPSVDTAPRTYGSRVSSDLEPEFKPKRAAGVQYFGVNIAGFDFGCGTDGTCVTSQVDPPLQSLGGADGAGQMSHFTKDLGMNIFRLPVGWQYLVDNQLGGTLNSGNAANYDQLVQACLSTGASCIIDIHNYARWNGAIIGQGGPTNAQFTSLWTQIATKYASTKNVIFGIMNEPHDLNSITTWAETVQAAVTAIREAETQANGIQHMLLLPGSSYSSAQTLPTEAGPALLGVVNPDNSTTNLIFDVHKYSDSDNSGTHANCTTDNISNAFQPLATWLRTNKRQALNTEMGGGNTASCEDYVCAQIQFVNMNADVYLGYVGWAAGSFNAQTYVLSEVPVKNGNTWTDQPLVADCFKDTY
ncbi:glycoside hydrolase family 5 protein [Xylariaceae sp. FL0255]|nr:glycoside hydrolase family 5 protein [Xylariaceae sp. FL0255]